MKEIAVCLSKTIKNPPHLKGRGKGKELEIDFGEGC